VFSDRDSTGRRRGPAAAIGSVLMQALLLALLLAGCARPAPPSADARQRPIPDLAGRTVMLLPVQAAIPTITLPATADPARPAVPLGAGQRAVLQAELAYWLPQQAPRARWVLPDAIERATAGSPAADMRPHELTVRDFQRSRLESIGDPLYGELRRIAVLMDARVALLPIGALWVPEHGGLGRVHLAAALIDTMGGDVVWYGVVAGTAGAAADAATLGAAARALAEMIPQ
jgi:hypothetical protein